MDVQHFKLVAGARDCIYCRGGVLHTEHLLLSCLDFGLSECEGPVEYRIALSGTGVSFPRCDKHWEERLQEQERIEERYPVMEPEDFDPSYAGERWEEDE